VSAGTSRFAGEVAIVTGGARGLGRGAVDRLVADGARVVVFDVIDGEGIPTVALAALDAASAVQLVRVNVSNSAAVRTATAAVVDRFGSLDMLVIGAGIAIPARRVVDVPESDIARLLAVNVSGVLASLQAALAHMETAKAGRIVVISSQTGKQAWGGWGVYSGSKAFSIALVQAIALEHAADGIRINALCPGTMESDMMRTAFTARTEETGRTLEQEIDVYARDRIPVGRMGTPADVGGATAWLLSEDASFVTGSAINLTGGEMVFF
jgi:NAD(P)-dependent dehydrogenase (short-subunit alcohol dehydrogenase family)